MTWIKTEEQLPKNEQSVLVFWSGHVEQASFYQWDEEDEGEFASDHKGLPASEIKYWMPLPEPPIQ